MPIQKTKKIEALQTNKKDKETNYTWLILIILVTMILALWIQYSK